MKEPLIFNIQKYSIHDGDGIRTTIFFKGCPLRCLWCHNPESQSYSPELMVYFNRCVLCGTCIKVCPHGVNEIIDGELILHRDRCVACGECINSCLHNAREMVGRTYGIKELVNEAAKDRMFYEQSGGGVTLSGGEVMCQDIDYVEELCRRLCERGIAVDIDTSGFADFSHFERLIPYVDVFLYDLKDMDPAGHRELIGADNALILDNLKRLSESGAKINIRLPLIAGMNAATGHIQSVIDFLVEHDIRPVQINLLPYHATGRTKYENLGRGYRDSEMSVPPAETMEEFRQLFISNGFTNTKIGG